MSEPEIKAGLYTRVSTQEQAQGGSIETQVEFGLRWFDLYNLDPIRIFRDEGVSGASPLETRPQGAQLLADAAAGRINAVYVYRVDRLARDLRHMLAAVHRLESYGCRLVSLTESFDTGSPAGRAMLGMLGVFAQYERDSIAERSTAGRRRVAREGRWPGGPLPPFGYRKEEGYLVPDEEPLPGLLLSRADVIRLIYRLLTEDRLSCYRIAEQLNALAVPTPLSGKTYAHGKSGQPPSGRWAPERIRNLVVMSVYAGRYRYGKRSKHAEGPVEYPCPALVSVETWEAAQAQLRANCKVAPGNARREYLLRGLMRCALCGHALQGWTPDPRYSYYVCAPKLRRWRHRPCPSAYLPARYEEELWAEVGRVLSDPAYRDDVRAVRVHPNPAPDDVVELAQLDQALAEKAQERERILALYRRGRIAETELDAQLDQADAEERELRARRATLLARVAPLPSPSLPGGSDYARLWKLYQAAEKPAARRQVIDALVDSILIHTVERNGKRVPEAEIRWRLS
ncbi:MAG TPA: recombinase family protein [Armatimonadota bacterium]|nr:recombinase family protein [Armatimonadota bacterium]